MKRFLTLLAVISMTLVAMAQHPMATLSHNGELTQFTGLHALDEAFDAAQLDDVIYLSEGTFSSSSNWRDIPYGISIIGSGYNSKILGELRYAPSERKTMDIPLIDGVNVGSITFFQEMPGDTKNMEICNSYIGALHDIGRAAENVYIDRCYIAFINFGEYDGSRQIYINNSKIERMDWGSGCAILSNCNIKRATDCPRIVNSCIIENNDVEDKLHTWDSGTHIINNSLFPSEEFVNGALDVTVLNNCYFENPANGLLDENLNATIDLQAKGYLGQDGTVIGAYGGDNPFSEYPSVPTIVSEKSSVEFDPASNKLNVTITVASN